MHRELIIYGKTFCFQSRSLTTTSHLFHTHTFIFSACSQKACSKCCTDKECEGHRDIREKEDILNGTHPINKMADAKRALTVKPGVFHDPAFRYLGETILIWSLSDYMTNSKWRDEAIRKSLRNIESRKQAKLVQEEALKRKKKRDGTLGADSEKCIGNKKETRKQRFHRVMNDLFQKIKDIE